MKMDQIFGIAAGAVLCACGTLLTACKDQQNSAASAQAGVIQVKTAALEQQNVAKTLQWYGYLRGVEDAAIRPQVTGTLVKKNYKDGAYVQEGDVLFEIDKSLFEATLHQAQAGLAQAKGSLEQAKAAREKNRLDVERYTKLVASGSVSEKNLTDSQQALRENEAQILVAEAQIQAAQAQIESAQTNLDYTTIKAPISGIAGIAKPSVGDLLSPSMNEPLVTISSVDPIRVDFSVPEQMALRALKRASESSIKKCTDFPFSLVLSDGTVYEEQGTIVSVDRAVSKTMGTLDLVGQIPNPSHVLRPGMSVTVQAEVGVKEDALLVPPRAIVSRQSANFIMVLGKNNVPAMLQVSLGELVTVAVKDANGQEVTQPMQVIEGQGKSVEDQLKAQGVTAPLNEVQVIVEGTSLASKAMVAHAPVKATPYEYVPSQPLISSKATTPVPQQNADQKTDEAKN